MNECSLPIAGSSTTCGHIAVKLAHSRNEVARIARLANRSPRHFARYANELEAAKQHLAEEREVCNAHMAECPAAAERFGASA